MTSMTILESARSFMQNRVLLTGADLDLYSLLAREPMTADAVAGLRNCDAAALTILLDALAGMGILIKQDQWYQTAPDAAPFLSADSRQSVLPMLQHQSRLWDKWTRLTDIVREGRSLAHYDLTQRPPADLQAFILAMHVAALPVASGIVQACPVTESGTLLDVGGGPGTYAEAFLQAYPRLKVIHFDLPQVSEIARNRLRDSAVLKRLSFVAGDFYKDELPGGVDVVFLSAIIHQNNRQDNQALYAKIRRALQPGGRLIIRDHVMEPDRIHPPAGALFAVNMLVATPGGNTYTLDEITQDLHAAGFDRPETIRRGEAMDCLITAKNSAA